MVQTLLMLTEKSVKQEVVAMTIYSAAIMPHKVR